MGSSWVRLDSDFSIDPKIVRAGWQGLVVWPIVLCLMKKGGGVLEEDALEPGYISLLTRVPEEVVLDGIEGLKRVGLLRLGSRTTNLGSAGVEVKSGFITPGWDKYQPDTRRASKYRNGSGSAGTESEQVVSGSQGTVGGSQGTVHGSQGRGECSQGRALARADALSRPVPSCSVSSGVEGSGEEGVQEASLEQYLKTTWDSKVTRGSTSLGDWIAAQTDAHPELDLLVEAKKARAYEVSKGTDYKAIRRMLSGWFNRAEGYKEEKNSTHWSGLTKREREQEIAAGNTAYRSNINGVGLWRDLRDGSYVLSAQDILNPELPYLKLVKACVEAAMGGDEDPYDHEAHVKALKKKSARAENSRNLTFAIDQIVAEVKGGAA